MRLLILTAALLGSAGAAPLKVLGTFTVISDLVKQVGGARVEVTSLVPPNGDTHTYEPSTGDIRKVADARLIFENGAGLEHWFAKLQGSVGPQTREVVLSDGLPKGTLEEDGAAVEDPHLWWNPQNVVVYVQKIRDALSAADPAGKTFYANSAAAYIARVRAADARAKALIATLPPQRRVLVTNHDALGYFARHYGFRVLGEVIPSLGTEQEPSAQASAKLIDALRAQKVRAIFTENTVNPRLARAIGQESGARVAPPLYTDALGAPGSAGDTYLRALAYNVKTIVDALK